MPKYQVAVVNRPENWRPESSDDVPLALSGPVVVLAESDDLFEAVARAVEHNESDRGIRRWAVVIEPGSMGRLWPAARICTPVMYKVAVIWWPDGWEPESPLDVPNCVWQSQGRDLGKWTSYPQAETIVLALNRQCMAYAGATWHVVVAVENETVSRVVSYDPVGTETTVEVRRMHVVRPKHGGHGTCRHCPAHEFQCARANWDTQPQTISARSRGAFSGASQQNRIP
jgi:hypothetical protein